MTLIPDRFGPAPSKMMEVWVVIRDSRRALTQAQIAEAVGYQGHQIGPILHVLTTSGWASVIEHGTRRWYCAARLRRWLVGDTSQAVTSATHTP